MAKKTRKPVSVAVAQLEDTLKTTRLATEFWAVHSAQFEQFENNPNDLFVAPWGRYSSYGAARKAIPVLAEESGCSPERLEIVRVQRRVRA